MLRVTIDSVPYGDESQAETIGTATITNLGSGTHELGNYLAGISYWRGDDLEHLCDVPVNGHPRQENVWLLLRKVLEAANLEALGEAPL